MIGHRNDDVTLNIFGKGKKLIGKAGFPDFIICVTIAQHIHFTGQLKFFQKFHLAFVLTQVIGLIESGDVSRFVKQERIGVHVFFTNAEISHNRNDKLFKTRRNNPDLVGKSSEEFSVSFE